MRYFISIVSIIAILFGCTAPIPHSIDNLPLKKIVAKRNIELFKADLMGKNVAISGDGLFVVPIESGNLVRLNDETPLDLAWSPDGSILAAAFPSKDGETLLIQYSPQGELLTEKSLPIDFGSLAWSDRGDLLVSGYVLQIYTFGANLTQSLYRVKGDEFIQIILSDTTLHPETVKRLVPYIDFIQPVAFSPYGDELVFISLHDPPEFPPYMEILHQNWQVGSPRSLMELPVQALELKWLQDKETVEIITESKKYHLQIWPSAEVQSTSDRNYRFSLGRLYDGDQLLTDWGAESKIQILHDGRFLLGVKNTIFLGSGLRQGTPTSHNEKNWKLRQWRAAGLISPDEFIKTLSKEQQ